MSYNYDGSGAVNVSGCASYDKYVYVEYKWPLNSLLFSKEKARKGIMELVAIKRLFVNNNTKTQRQPVKIYQDTHNGLWNERDLLEEADARALAIAYWEKRKQQIIKARCQDPL